MCKRTDAAPERCNTKRKCALLPEVLLYDAHPREINQATTEAYGETLCK